jgi:tetratricopeptide (TPR) repeat protein
LETNYIEKALEITNLIQDEKERSETLGTIAIYLAEYSDNIEKALEICALLPDPEKRSFIYSELGYALADRGLGRKGIETILLSENFRDSVASLLALSRMIKDEDEKGKWILRVNEYFLTEWKKNPSQENDRLLELLISYLQRVEKYEEAFALSDLSTNSQKKFSCICDMAEYYVERGEIDKALELAQRLESKSDEARFYARLAEKMMVHIIRNEPPSRSSIPSFSSSLKTKTETINVSELETLLKKHIQG